MTPGQKRRAERNARIAADYVAGMSQADIAEREGMTPPRVWQIIAQQVGKDEARRIGRERQAAAVKANWQDPAFRERQAAATKAANVIQWTPDMDAALRDSRAAGVSVIECANIIGVCASVCRKRMAELGIA